MNMIQIYCVKETLKINFFIILAKTFRLMNGNSNSRHPCSLLNIGGKLSFYCLSYVLLLLLVLKNIHLEFSSSFQRFLNNIRNYIIVFHGFLLYIELVTEFFSLILLIWYEPTLFPLGHSLFSLNVLSSSYLSGIILLTFHLEPLIFMSERD